MEKIDVNQESLKNLYLHDGNIEFTVERGKERSKMVGTTRNGFRAFAYFRHPTEKEDAKISILMEFKTKNWR